MSQNPYKSLSLNIEKGLGNADGIYLEIHASLIYNRDNTCVNKDIILKMLFKSKTKITIIISAAVIAIVAIGLGSYFILVNLHKVEIKNIPAYAATLNALGENGVVREDLMRRGLFSIPQGGTPGQVKFGEIQKLIDAGFYAIDNKDTLQFGPNYVPLPITTTSPATTPPPTPPILEIVSIVGPVPPYGPGGGSMAVTVKNPGEESIISINATLKLEPSWPVYFLKISRDTPLRPDATDVQNILFLPPMTFDYNTPYQMDVHVTLQSGKTYFYTETVKITKPPASETGG